MARKIQETLMKAAKELYPLITKDLSDQSAKKYNNDAWTLSELDLWKNIDLPKLLLKRKDSKDGIHLTKEELVLLMDWKLAKGKFRPTLPKLIKSNSAESVLECTKEGFALFMKNIESAEAKDWSQVSLQDYKNSVKSSLKLICQLKGIGPATGSLLLSSLSEVTQFAPPFFSDESFMYFIRDPLRPSQPIKYTVKEYIEELLLVLVNLSAEDKQSTPVVLEKGAWSLKMYHMYRIDRLADIEIPFEVEDADLELFPKTLEYLDGAAPVKRSANTDDKPSKKKSRS